MVNITASYIQVGFYHLLKHTHRILYTVDHLQTKLEEANSENCDPPSGNNFDLEAGQSQGLGMVQIESTRNAHMVHIVN